MQSPASVAPAGVAPAGVAPVGASVAAAPVALSHCCVLTLVLCSDTGAVFSHWCSVFTLVLCADALEKGPFLPFQLARD